MATTSNNSCRILHITITRLRPRIAKISVQIILTVILVAALINGIIILKDVLDQHTALQHSIQQVNKSVAQMEKIININMTDVNAQLQEVKQELKETEQKLGEFSKLSDAVKQLNKTVEELIHHKYNSADGIAGTYRIAVMILFTVLLSFYQQMHDLCS